jgi:undecaprenyl-diphosphatase
MATILAGMLVGLPVGLAARFSFLLAIPTMLLAGGYRLFSHRDDLSRDALFIIAIGSLTAFVVALVVVAAFMQYIRSHRFTPFAVYRLLLGLAVLWWAS